MVSLVIQAPVTLWWKYLLTRNGIINEAMEKVITYDKKGFEY